MSRNELSPTLNAIFRQNKRIDNVLKFRKRKPYWIAALLLTAGFAAYTVSNQTMQDSASVSQNVSNAVVEIPGEMPKFDPAAAKTTNQMGNIEKRLYEHIATKYRIAKEAAKFIVERAFVHAKSQEVDPVMMLAIMAQESRFNPIAESFTGAAGMSQIQPVAHPEKIATISEDGHLLSIDDNIRIGTRVYGEYSRKFHGDPVKALQQYNGSLNDRTRAYSGKVIKNYDEFKAIARNLSVPQKTVKELAIAPKKEATAKVVSAVNHMEKKEKSVIKSRNS